MAETPIRWKKDLRKLVEAKIRDAAMQGVTEAADQLKTDAGETVPHQTGDLEGSANVSTDKSKLAAVVYYDTPYAVRQHEDTRLRHPDPRHTINDKHPSSPRGRAKWLQLTLQENADRYRDHVAETIRKATEGG